MRDAGRELRAPFSSSAQRERGREPFQLMAND